jgi:hypothetical protein
LILSGNWFRGHDIIFSQSGLFPRIEGGNAYDDQ